MIPEAYDNQVEVTVRLLQLVAPADIDSPTATSEPAVIVTTFLNGRMFEREIYNQHGEEIWHGEPKTENQPPPSQ